MNRRPILTKITIGLLIKGRFLSWLYKDRPIKSTLPNTESIGPDIAIRYYW